MDDAQVRTSKPMGISFTVSLSLHVLVLLMISFLGGAGGVRPSLDKVLMVGLVSPEGDEKTADKGLTRMENTSTLAEKVPVPHIVQKEKKVAEPKKVSMLPAPEKPLEEKAEDQEKEITDMTGEEDAAVQQIEAAVIEEFGSEAVLVEPGTEERESSASSPNVVREDGPGKAKAEGTADVTIEPPGLAEEGTRPGVDARIFAIIRNRIQAAKRYPYIARVKGMEGTVLVEFSIAEDGNPTDIGVSKSSGHDLLDEEAEETIKRASPYPFFDKKVVFPVTFRLKTEKGREPK